MLVLSAALYYAVLSITLTHYLFTIMTGKRLSDKLEELFVRQ